MTLHLVTGSDDNYVAGVMVLIASAAFHTPDIRATVLDLGISAENRARIDALGARLGIALDRIAVPEDALDHMPVRRAHLTRGTFLRLLIPDLMPRADRVLYMDCDMVVLGDLTPLAHVALGAAPFAAVPCPSPMDHDLTATGVARGDYVNAGLLVMNLPVWRAERLAETCVDRFTADGGPRLSGDQATLNLVGKGRVVRLPDGYNLYADPAAYPGPAQLPDEVRVVHYVVNTKPWAGPATLDCLWHSHAARIADLLPPARPERFKRRLSRLNRARRQAVGALLRRPKYLARAAVAQAMQDRIAAPYLERYGAALRDVSAR